MTFKEKINRLDVDTLTNEEVYALWGTTEKAENDKMDQLIRQMNYEANVEMGKIRNKRMLEVKRLLQDRGPMGAQFRNVLAVQCPALFRNLENLTDEQLEQIARDVEILEILEKEDEQSK